MGFFIDKHHRRKSSMAVTAFFAALIDLFVFGILYGVLSEPLYRLVRLGSEASSTVVQGILIALLGTALCCLQFLLRDKRIAPYGFAGLAVAIVILAVGLNFLKESCVRIFSPRELELGNGILWFFALTIPVKLWMFFFNRSLGKRLDSPVLLATAFDSLSDILTSLVVLISLVVMRTTGWRIDGYAGFIVALFVIAGGIRVVRDTVNPLLGECPDQELVNGVEQTILENTDICGVHDLIMHNYGPGRYFASAHAEVHSDCDPVKIHDSLEATEVMVSRRYPVQLTLHCDPFNQDDPEYKFWRLKTVAAAEAMNAEFKVYDFRMTMLRNRHVFFNLLVPRNCPASHQELTTEIQRRLREFDPNVTVAIKVENAYV